MRTFLKSSGQNGMVGRERSVAYVVTEPRTVSISKSASAVEARWTDFDRPAQRGATIGYWTWTSSSPIESTVPPSNAANHS